METTKTEGAIHVYVRKDGFACYGATDEIGGKRKTE